MTQVWSAERPPQPLAVAFAHDERYAGQSVAEKVCAVADACMTIMAGAFRTRVVVISVARWYGQCERAK